MSDESNTTGAGVEATDLERKLRELATGIEFRETTLERKVAAMTEALNQLEERMRPPSSGRSRFKKALEFGVPLLNLALAGLLGAAVVQLNRTGNALEAAGQKQAQAEVAREQEAQALREAEAVRRARTERREVVSALRKADASEWPTLVVGYGGWGAAPIVEVVGTYLTEETPASRRLAEQLLQLLPAGESAPMCAQLRRILMDELGRYAYDSYLLAARYLRKDDCSDYGQVVQHWSPELTVGGKWGSWTNESSKAIEPLNDLREEFGLVRLKP